MKFGTGDGANLHYCGRVLGRDRIPGSDGQCGPNNGPQCSDCIPDIRNKAGIPVRLGTGYGARTYYCGRILGRDRIPGSDGQCGPTDGPSC